jgi:hypothetical protein
MNMVHVASNFKGTLSYTTSTPNAGSTNILQDDINSNTFTAAHNSNGLGFAEMDGAGGLFTNLNCTDMTKGWCLYNGTLGGYAGGTALFSAVASTGVESASAHLIVGTTFSSNSGCSESSLIGGASAGKFTVGTSSACTIVITMGNSASAAHGWSCWANDETHVPTVAIRETDSNTTSVSLLMTVTASDVIDFGCVGY